MEKEEFKNPIDWVIYKVNGKLPSKPKESRLKLEKHSLPKDERKYAVKYYHNNNGRYSAFYNKKHLCMCDYGDIPKIQQYFDKHYNGKNINYLSKTLKKRYNQKRKKQRGVKGKPYSKNRLNFQKKKNGRICARVSDNGKIHTICQCYENQRKEVSHTYDSLKKTHDIESIKEIMKERYNIIATNIKYPHLNKHQINIMEDGAVYKDGKFVKVDSNIYEFINTYIKVGEK